MQTLVRWLRAAERATGLDSRVVSLLEPPLADGDAGLVARWSSTPAGMRRDFRRRATPFTADATVVYHNGWGLTLFAPGDGAARRAVFLHTNAPGIERSVAAMLPWCDGFLVLNSGFARQVSAWAGPEFESRVFVTPCPVIAPPGFRPDLARPASRPLRVGFIGRIEREQKRAERLPALAELLRRQGVAIEWHIVGDGPERTRLAASIGKDVVWHGWKSGTDYWRVLAHLDMVLSLSDYETGPIALLEAMHAGAVPLVPAIGGLGEPAAMQVAAACVYPAGNLAAAAGQLAHLAECQDFASLRVRAQAAVAGLSATAAAEAYCAALAEIERLPRHSSAAATRLLRWSDCLPLAAVARFYPAAIWH